MKFSVVAFVVLALMTSCTQNQLSRTYGGSSTVKLPKGRKLMTATWKDADLWYLTRPMKPGEEPEALTFQEDSNYGLMNGTVTFVENK